MMLALLFVGLSYSALAPSNAQADEALAGADATHGRDLFVANCATCHGLDAQGTDLAPSLVGVGAASVHFQVSTGRMPMANNSPQAEPKDPVMADEQTAALSAYVASLRPGPSIPSAEQGAPDGGNAAPG